MPSQRKESDAAYLTMERITEHLGGSTIDQKSSADTRQAAAPFQVSLTFDSFCDMGDNSRMSTKRIADHQWQKLYAFLQGHPRAYAGQEEKCRRFVEAVHWILRTGAQWRELPDRYGKWNSIFKRYARWEENGVWADMFKQFAQDPEMAAVMPDSTTVRAHMCAAGGSKKGAVSKNSAQVGVGADSAARSISSSMPLARPFPF